MKALKYLTILTLPVISIYAVHGTGWITFLPLLYAFGFIPTVELFVTPDSSNLSADREAALVKDKAFDVIIYVCAFFHLGFFIYFFAASHFDKADKISWLGNTLSLGLMCGIFGINIAHELGHRPGKADQSLSKVLLLTSLYMHFFIEHNKGHHRYVSTDRDPASAPKHMALYRFWLRSIFGSYLSAWKLERERLKKTKLPWFKNGMITFQLIQLGICAMISLLFGYKALVAFLLAALIGILLLETVNYIEHYGLRRKQLPDGNYERAMPCHSWNSDHMMGRLMLFELSRHSDHHYLASRKYQILRHHENSPQLPTGYPGMMILSFIPPVWFWIVHREMQKFEKSTGSTIQRISGRTIG